MDLKILTSEYLDIFTARIKVSPIDLLEKVESDDIQVDYFQFYKSVSSVYSSKIEGENIDFDSYFKHKFLNIQFKPDYTAKADDLYLAYDFIENNKLNFNNLCKAHSILSKHLLPENRQGKIRTTPMFVINNDDKIEYVATNPANVKTELNKLFDDINLLLNSNLNDFEIFYYASFIHLVFVKIHPFDDGNGRSARLLEKWFLMEKIGKKATAIQLEKNYYKNINEYYGNIKKIGLEYEFLDYSKSIDFLSMTALLM